MGRKPILFVDFDGVLSYDRYWRSLPAVDHERVQDLLFRNNTSLVDGWVRGRHSAEEVNAFVSESLGISYNYLWSVFVDDCKTIRVSMSVLEFLHRLRNRYVVVLITGNMDSFTRYTVPALRLREYFDCISNSYDEGIHKTDNDGSLFLKYVQKYDAVIEDCILLDDSKKVCEVFRCLGGDARLVDPEHDIRYHLTGLIA